MDGRVPILMHGLAHVCRRGKLFLIH
jgi:hypothetical protein